MAPLVRTGGSRHTGLAAPPHRNIHFADTIDFTFEKISEDSIHIAIGKASCYCYDDIDVTLQLSDGVDMETATKELYEDLNERLSA